MWRPPLAGHPQAEGQASLSSAPDQSRLRNEGGWRADVPNATAGDWRRLTTRCSRRGRHHGFSWYEVVAAGPAAELCRSAAWLLARDVAMRSPPLQTLSQTVTYEEACERVLRCLRLSWHRNDVHIHSSKEYPTHWLITYALPSLEDPSRIFLTAEIVAEKQSGAIYRFPSRSREPIDRADISSIVRGCSRLTLTELEKWEREEKRRVRKPGCFACRFPDVKCDGGHVFHVSGQADEFIEWVHTCDNCDNVMRGWSTGPKGAAEHRCPFPDCESVCRRTENPRE
jgi:hypothetical protein